MRLMRFLRIVHLCDRADRRVTNVVNPPRFIARSIHSDSLSRGGGISERSAQARTSASSMTLGARDQIVKRCLIVDAVVGLQRSRHALDREPVPLDQRGNFLL